MPPYDPKLLCEKGFDPVTSNSTVSALNGVLKILVCHSFFLFDIVLYILSLLVFVCVKEENSLSISNQIFLSDIFVRILIMSDIFRLFWLIRSENCAKLALTKKNCLFCSVLKREKILVHKMWGYV